ncbi:MAG: hypothetical protein K2X98_01045 [Alphaproteobacteria bacterium]|nr:hypothetical protein [Alphaproteobacteria bacterium]
MIIKNFKLIALYLSVLIGLGQACHAMDVRVRLENKAQQYSPKKSIPLRHTPIVRTITPVRDFLAELTILCSLPTEQRGYRPFDSLKITTLYDKIPESVIFGTSYNELPVETDASAKAARIRSGAYIFTQTIGHLMLGNQLTFGEFLHASQDITYLSQENISFANTCRHLKLTDSSQKKGGKDLINSLGDYIAEKTLITLICHFEKNQTLDVMTTENQCLLSEAYYQLSQTYMHTMKYTSRLNKNNELRIPEKNKELGITVCLENMMMNRFLLLKNAILLNPENLNAWLRVAEIYAHEGDKISRFTSMFPFATDLMTMSLVEIQNILELIKRAQSNPDCVKSLNELENKNVLECFNRALSHKKLLESSRNALEEGLRIQREKKNENKEKKEVLCFGWFGEDELESESGSESDSADKENEGPKEIKRKAIALQSPELQSPSKKARIETPKPLQQKSSPKKPLQPSFDNQ